MTTLKGVVLTDRSRIETLNHCARLRYYEYEYCGRGVELGDTTALNIGSAVHLGVGAMVEAVRQHPLTGSWVGYEPLLAEGLRAALAAPEYAVLENEDDRDLVEALVRTWWVVGLPAVAGWEVMSVEKEEWFDYQVPMSPSHHHNVEGGLWNPVPTVRLMTRSDWIARAPQVPPHFPNQPGSALQELLKMPWLNNAPVASGIYNWNLKTWKRCDDRRVRSLDYDAQLSTELLGPERRLGTRLTGNVWQILIKENHPLVWCWRSAKRGTIVHQYQWTCETAHENTHTKSGGWCPGGKFHRLGDDFERVRVRDVYTSQEAAFAHLMETNLSVLEAFHRILGPYPRRSDYEIKRWLRQNLNREAQIAAVRSFEPLTEEDMDVHFVQSSGSNCLYPVECPALQICFGSDAPEVHEWRRANHPEGGEHVEGG